MLIDSHVHVWQAEPRAAAPVATIVRPDRDVPIELLERHMADHGVERCVLVQPAFRGEDNDYVARCAAERPERFAAVCVVDPRLPDAASRLHHWVKERGCRGLRLRPMFADEEASFGHASTFPLWHAAAELEIPVNILAAPRHLPRVAELAQRFPEVPIVLDHLAHPDLTAGPQAAIAQLRALARYPRVHLKLSGFYHFTRQAWPFEDCQPLVEAALSAYGRERLLWGSDFPHVLLKTGYKASIRCVANWISELDADGLSAVMGRNAARLYWGDR